MEEIRFHGADRAAEDSGDLFVRQLVVHAEHERRPLLLRQVRDRGAHFYRALRAQKRRICRFGPRVHVLTRLESLERRRFRRDAVEAEVDGNPVEPGADRRLSLETAEGAVGADERFLRQIARVLVVAGETIAESIHLSPVAFDEDVEGPSPARETLLHQRMIVGRRPGGVDHVRHLGSCDLHVPATRRFERQHTGSHGTLSGLDTNGGGEVTARIDFRFSFAYSARMLPLTKRQREILDYLNDFIQQHGYAPSLEEIGRRFGLSSLATVHKHLTNLQEKGFIKRAWNRSRSVEMIPTRSGGRALELPLLGYVAAGSPIEAVAGTETIAVPESLVGKRDTYVLRVKGDSMIDEQIRDGDYVIVEDRRSADNGEMVIAMLHGSDVTLKKLFREQGRIRLQPANAALQPIFAAPDDVQVQGVVVGVMRKY